MSENKKWHLKGTRHKPPSVGLFLKEKMIHEFVGVKFYMKDCEKLVEEYINNER